MTELRDPALLDHGFRADVERLIAALHAQGFEFRLSTTLRTPWQQARLWRQSRSRETVSARIVELRQAGAGYLADVLEAVGPQSGPPVTKAIPGLSWHQWGEAADLFLVERGAAVWDPGHAGYHALAITAETIGLRSGRSFGDPPHVQARRTEPSALPLAEVAEEMEARFGRDERAWLAANTRPAGVAGIGGVP